MVIDLKLDYNDTLIALDTNSNSFNLISTSTQRSNGESMCASGALPNFSHSNCSVADQKQVEPESNVATALQSRIRLAENQMDKMRNKVRQRF